MAVSDPKAPPPFYSQYVTDVQHRIANNAALEFERLWKMHTSTGQPLCVASDELSLHITKLKDAIQASSLFDDELLRVKVSCLCVYILQLVF